MWRRSKHVCGCHERLHARDRALVRHRAFAVNWLNAESVKIELETKIKRLGAKVLSNRVVSKLQHQCEELNQIITQN